LVVWEEEMLPPITAENGQGEECFVSFKGSNLTDEFESTLTP